MGDDGEMAIGEEERLLQALDSELEALRQVEWVIGQLGHQDPYREVLERHRGTLAEAISELEHLVESWWDEC